MIKEIQIQVSPEEASKEELLRKVVSEKLGISLVKIIHITIVKRSIDARQRNIKVNKMAHSLY